MCYISSFITVLLRVLLRVLLLFYDVFYDVFYYSYDKIMVRREAIGAYLTLGHLDMHAALVRRAGGCQLARRGR